MRVHKLYPLAVALAVILILSFSLPANIGASALDSQTVTVMVGLENPQQGIDVNAYFPETVTIHVGDTVHWMQNTNEIHTVTFPAGEDLPPIIGAAAEFGYPDGPSPAMFNPGAVNPLFPAGGQYNGGTFANSGLMGREPGQLTDFSLTFTAQGTFDYVCLVHGTMMSGHVAVVANNASVPSPQQVNSEAKQEIAKALSKVPGVRKAAAGMIEPVKKNSDGTLTHHILIGYSDGQIDLMQFFPDKLVVRPGDTVIWEMSAFNDAPHTVTFLNGAEEPDLVTVVSQTSGPPLLYINPGTLFPYQPSGDLNRQGIYNSGIMNPVPGTTYSLKIGKMKPGPQPWLCLLHDTSGMKGTLIVLPR